MQYFRLDISTSSFKPVLVITLLAWMLGACGSSDTSRETASNTMVDLGERIYFDENLSNPPGQSCASCHAPEAGFADPDSHLPVSEGVVANRFGARNSPTASYASLIPGFGFRLNRNGNGIYFGGQFLDGRAGTLELQAQGPFLNPLEMNMADRAAVIEQVRSADYAAEFESLFGEAALDDVDQAYEQLSSAIAAFERSDRFAPFNSKFDAVIAGDAIFSGSEANGFALFNGRADCRRCHSTPANQAQVFSNFEYRNIGTPANPDNPFLALDASLNPDGANFIDAGLGSVLDDANENGKFRTPTLRNIALTSPYMHNGVFNTLQQVVEFYNRRDIDNVSPEVAQNVDVARNIGNLGLSPGEVQDIVAFLETLSDGY